MYFYGYQREPTQREKLESSFYAAGFSSRQVEHIEKLAREGKTVRQICEAMKMTGRDFEYWLRETPEAREAIQRGRLLGEADRSQHERSTKEPLKAFEMHQSILDAMMYPFYLRYGIDPGKE
ncbi:MAG: hypothetical protein K2X93_22995 [Candidatus Obscuribacterales bacterium]|nr:hypothetical protein [Candidatus Obscuribacterales bacterium]